MIRQYGDPILLKPCEPVEHFDSELADLAEAMHVELASSADGLGLAANQFGVSRQVIVYNLGGTDKGVLVNPKITASDGRWVYKEGCLSIPGMFWYIERPDHVVVSYYDLDGNAQVRRDGKLAGRLWQHEMDHIDGRLILDRLAPGLRKQAIRKLGKKANV